MEIGVAFIIIAMLVVVPVAIALSKTSIFRSMEDKFFEDHDHYM